MSKLCSLCSTVHSGENEIVFNGVSTLNYGVCDSCYMEMLTHISEVRYGADLSAP